MTTQPGVSLSNPFPYNPGSPWADAVIGNFDTENSKELVLYQTNRTISLEEIDVASVNKYRTLYTDTTEYITKSPACDLLKIPGKEQVITVLLGETQIGLSVYSFKDGQKLEWGTPALFDHGMQFSTISALGISVTDILPNNTIEVVACVTKMQNADSANPRLQTHLIKLIIHMATKTFSLAAKQQLAEFTAAGFFAPGSTEHHVYQSNGCVYLNYLSADNTLSLAAFKWDGTAYEEVWKDDYKKSDPGFMYINQPPLLFEVGKEFYFVHVLQDEAAWPAHVEIYQQQDDGSLSKSKTITYPSVMQGAMHFWGGVYIEDSLYLMQVTNLVGNNLPSPYIFYRVDEVANELTMLSSTPASSAPVAAPIVALSDYALKAEAPNVTSLTESLQAVAILDSPPISSLIDYSNGTDYPSLTYLFQEQRSSSENVETQTDRSRSDEVGAGLDVFGLKISGDISNEMTQSSNQSHESQYKVIQNTQITCQEQDMVVFLGMSFDIYEYPITLRGKPSGYFLFLVPTSAPHVYIDTGRNMFRRTPHQIGNLLSYSSQGPSDIQQLLYTSEFGINATESYKFSVDYGTLHTSSSSTTATTTVKNSLSLGAEFPVIEGVGASIDAKLEGSYTDTEINISSFTIEKEMDPGFWTVG